MKGEAGTVGGTGDGSRECSRISSGMYGFRTVIATEREPLNYKNAVGKFKKSH